MNYEKTLHFLHHRVAYFSRKNDNYIFHLNITRRFLERLGNPHQHLSCIHIAGTNGKGSLVAMLSAVFMEGGYKVGSYTSPHLFDTRERIRINHVKIPPEYIVDFVHHHLNFIETYQPSFFEIMTVMAFTYFYEQKVDIALIEVGLGGRLDSTNVITPLLSMISSISYDHTLWLGTDLVSIAREKAGIIKEGVPIVIGNCAPICNAVFKKYAMKKKAPIYFSSDTFEVTHFQETSTVTYFTLHHLPTSTSYTYTIPLKGHYQQKNIACMMQGVLCLQERFPISASVIAQGLTKVSLQGRWQTLNNTPRVLIDVGHNRGAMEAIVVSLRTIIYEKLFIIISLTQDRQVQDVLFPLPQEAMYYCVCSDSPRSMMAKDIADVLQEIGRESVTFESPQQALDTACARANPKDMILITGSFFLIASLKESFIARGWLS